MNQAAASARPGDNGFRSALLLLLLLVLVPLLVYAGHGEADRWRAAVLLERYLDGERKPAIAELQEIVQRQPHDQQLRATLARWLLDDGRAEEALAMVESVPESTRTAALLRVYEDCLVANGRTADAIAVYRHRNAASHDRVENRKLEHLNHLSYLQALDGSDLELALKNASFVVAGRAATWNSAYGSRLNEVDQVVLLSVIVYRGSSGAAEAGQQLTTSRYREQIFRILDPAIERLAGEYRNAHLLNHPLARQIRDRLLGQDDSGDQDDSGESEAVRGVEQVVGLNLATLLTLRALVWQDLGELERSFADRRRVGQLGYDPAEIASSWPSRSICARQLTLLAMTLDTRGCVWFMMAVPPPLAGSLGQPGDALRPADRDRQIAGLERAAEMLGPALSDLNLALVAQEALVETGADQWQGSALPLSDVRELDFHLQEQPRKTLAVLLFHRSWVLNALGRLQQQIGQLRSGSGSRLSPAGYLPAESIQALEDIRRIRELGFVPGDQLF